MRRAVNYLIVLIRLAAAKRSTRREGKDPREEGVTRAVESIEGREGKDQKEERRAN